MKKLAKFEKLWLAAPVAIWFSFQPLIRLGQDETMYFELSLTLLYVAVLAGFAIPIVWQQRRALLTNKAAILAASFVAVLALSLLWTPNITRGVLTLGVAGLLLLILLASIARAEQLRRLIPTLTKVFFISAVVVAILAVVQLIAGMWVDREVALLCAGCVAEQFGFVRPNVFTIEPQFLGSMLIAPALLGIWLLLKDKLTILATSGLLLILVALFLTLSRGAIFAFAIGLLILLIATRTNIARHLRAIGLVVAGFALCLVLQGLAAASHPTINETFAGAVSSSVDQLSLGLIDIPVDQQIPQNQAGTDVVETPKYDGYVEESTNVRLSLSAMALTIWSADPLRVLFGVGIGGAGVALSQAFPEEIGAREIVQNEYLSLLLEVGLVGLALFVALLGVLLYRLGRIGAWWGVAIMVAFIAQWNFFSGYPNALHIYLVLIFFAVYAITAHRGRSTPAK